MTLPIIDVSSLNERTARELVDAVSNHGFVYIKNVNTGLSGAPLDSMFSLVSLYVVGSPRSSTNQHRPKTSLALLSRTRSHVLSIPQIVARTVDGLE